MSAVEPRKKSREDHSVRPGREGLVFSTGSGTPHAGTCRRMTRIRPVSGKAAALDVEGIARVRDRSGSPMAPARTIDDDEVAQTDSIAHLAGRVYAARPSVVTEEKRTSSPTSSNTASPDARARAGARRESVKQSRGATSRNAKTARTSGSGGEVSERRGPWSEQTSKRDDLE